MTGLRGFVEIPEGNEDELEKAVANVGPISVGIEASFLSMQFYSTGIYIEPLCDPQNINRKFQKYFVSYKNMLKIFLLTDAVLVIKVTQGENKTKINFD